MQRGSNKTDPLGPDGSIVSCPRGTRCAGGTIEEIIPNEKHCIWGEGDRKPNGKRYQPSCIIYGAWEDVETELAKIYLQGALFLT